VPPAKSLRLKLKQLGDSKIMFLNFLLAFMAAISPGPNIVLVIQNSLVYGRKNALMTAFGVLCGVLFWLLFLMLGFVYIVKKPLVLFFFHCFAAVFLLYIAYLISKIKLDKNLSTKKGEGKFFAESLVVTLLNPEIAIFYGSILSSIVTSDAPANFSLMATYLFGFMAIEATVFLSTAYFVSYISKFVFSYLKI
jgi:threonine/homoserine/homoserine lactone efflux protein